MTAITVGTLMAIGLVVTMLALTSIKVSEDIFKEKAKKEVERAQIERLQLEARIKDETAKRVKELMDNEKENTNEA
jgi:hypothetical protein